MTDPGATDPAVRDQADGEHKALRDAFLRHLVGTLRPPAAGDIEAKEAVPFPLCEPPKVRTGPEFVLYYRRIVEVPPLRQPGPEGVWTVRRAARKNLGLSLGCTPAECVLDVGLSMLIEQRWNLLALEIGDLASTIALAPAEDLTIEVVSSQRKLLEQKVVDSTEELRSTESMTADKEVMNVARSASRTNSWKVDGSGSFSLGFFSLGVGASASETINRSAQESMQRIHEQTVKSSHTLKTMRKIEVRGVTEGFVQNRMTRRIRNPYPDRTLSINVFELQKRFAVALALAELRLVAVLTVDLEFNEEFIAYNMPFLKEHLLDESLVEELPQAAIGASPPPRIKGLDPASKWAQRALRLLFEDTEVFHLLTGLEVGDTAINANDPAASFNEPWAAILAHPNDIDVFRNLPAYRDKSAYHQASRHPKVFTMYAVLAFFYRSYVQLGRPGVFDEIALPLATGLAKRLGAVWTEIHGGGVEEITGDNDAANVLREIMQQDPLDGNALTEVFRRVPGFLALMNEVAGTGAPAAPEADGFSDAVAALSRLLHHLRCNRPYYVQRYLEYVATSPARPMLVDLVEDAFDDQPGAVDLRRVFDPEACYIDRDAVIVPGLPVPRTQIGDLVSSLADAAPVLDGDAFVTGGDVVVPADGVHLEVAAGQCVLAGVDAQSQQPQAAAP